MKAEPFPSSARMDPRASSAIHSKHAVVSALDPDSTLSARGAMARSVDPWTIGPRPTAITFAFSGPASCRIACSPPAALSDGSEASTSTTIGFPEADAGRACIARASQSAHARADSCPLHARLTCPSEASGDRVTPPRSPERQGTTATAGATVVTGIARRARRSALSPLPVAGAKSAERAEQSMTKESSHGCMGAGGAAEGFGACPGI